jgi:hypothetical protein
MRSSSRRRQLRNSLIAAVVAAPIALASASLAQTPPAPAAQALGFNEDVINQRLDEAETKADQRLAHMKIGQDAMAPPDTGDYGGELQDMAATQRQIRLLELKQREAELAIKLWSTVNDGKRDAGAGAGAGGGGGGGGGGFRRRPWELRPRGMLPPLPRCRASFPSSASGTTFARRCWSRTMVRSSLPRARRCPAACA